VRQRAEAVAAIAIHREDAYARRCEAVVTRLGDDGVELDRTVFYPLGGGQAGDLGTLRLADGTQLPVIDARKARREDATPDDTLHVLDPGSLWQSRLAVGDAVTAEIDWERRYRHMRFHTATHLLCAVVRELVDGCSITADYARLDFAMTAPLDKGTVQQGLDELIGRGLPVGCEWISDEQLRGRAGQDLDAMRSYATRKEALNLLSWAGISRSQADVGLAEFDAQRT